MDDLDLSEPVLFQTLRELDFINHVLGGNQISLSAFERKTRGLSSVSIMDMGTGSGEMLKKMHQKSLHVGITMKGLGNDANPHIVAYAENHTKKELKIEYVAKDVFDKSCYSTSVDIIHACLFTHHFTEEQLVWLFRQWKASAREAVIINDLHRHPLAYFSIKWLTQLFSKSSMVKFDAPLSVARGFKKKELQQVLQKAGIQEYQLKWKWAFRWLLIF